MLVYGNDRRMITRILFIMILLLGGCDGTLYPLPNAVKNGDTAKVLRLLDEGGMINQRDYQGAAPLHYAALYDHVEIAELLISRGADIEVSTRREHATPLHFAAFARSEKVLAVLIANHANVHATASRHTLTPLHLACRTALESMGNVKRTPPKQAAIRQLLAAGADLNARNAYGDAPNCPA